MPFLSFANPAGLWFLPLAGLPLLIHLFRRRRAPVILFPDIRLLQQIQNAAIRPSRIKEYLLLAVRTLVILLLALGLARPMISLKLPGWLAGASQNCVLIMDNSASMAAISDGTTLLERAKRSAGQTIKSMSPNARVAVISAVPGSPAACGLSSPSRAWQVLEALPQASSGTDLVGAIHTADQILENAGAPGGRIIIYSDLQRTALGPKLQPLSRLSSAPVVTIYPAGPVRPLSNLIWQKVQARPLVKKIIVQGRILGGRIPQIGLAAGGQAIYRADPVPGREGEFTTSFGLPDRDSLYLFTSGDDLPLDDRYYLAAAAPAVKNVLLFSDRHEKGNDYLLRAFSALGTAGFRIKEARSWESQYSKGYDLIAVNKAAVDKTLADAIVKSMHNGAGLLIVPSLESDPSSYNYLLKQFSDVTLSGLADSLAHNIYRLNRSGSREDVLSDLNQAQLSGVKIKTYWKASSRLEPELNVNHSDPALIFVNGGTIKAAVLLAGDQPGFGDLVFKPAFLVMILQTAGQLTQRAGRQLVAGNSLSDSGTGSGKYQSPGWVREKGGGMEAVNIAAAESDLAPATGPELELFLGNTPWQVAGTGSGPLAGRSPALKLLLFFAGWLLILEMILRSASKI
jgi:hypothetical protein